MVNLIVFITIFSMAVIVYHHVGYPIILIIIRKLNSNRNAKVKLNKEKYIDDKITSSTDLPSITVVMPAYNEEKFIAEKIKNLASLYYPNDKLKIIIATDGCTDNTVMMAQATQNDPICKTDNIDLRVFHKNRGKIAVINDVVTKIDSDLVMFTDVSSLVSLDALSIAAQRFQQPNIGALNGNYRLLHPGSDGEAMYWQYQSAIKIGEELLGSVLGAHGACYFLRTALFRQLPANCINDDFIIPMRTIEQGYVVAYEPRLNAVELEQSNADIDWNRRLRISAGNFQQILLLYKLLNPSYRGVCLAFISGKTLRITMPFFMLLSFLGSWLLIASPLFLFIALCQSVIYGAVILKHICRIENTGKYFNLIDYLISGHAANFLGVVRYLIHAGRIRWH